jgi:hypothetical protein
MVPLLVLFDLDCTLLMDHSQLVAAGVPRRAADAG